MVRGQNYFVPQTGFLAASPMICGTRELLNITITNMNPQQSTTPCLGLQHLLIMPVSDVLLI